MPMASDIDVPSTGLLKSWIETQLDQASKARFVDNPSFKVSGSFTSPTGHDPLDPIAHDYDRPVAAHLDPESIKVEGLRHVGGIDIGYHPTDPNTAIVVLVILTYPGLELKHTFKRQIRPTQPYVPSFLSMRELEHVLAIYDEAIIIVQADERPDVLFVDGLGRWHERQAGLATAFGVERGCVTIGVGKEYQPLRPDLARFVERGEWPVPMPPWPEDSHFRSKQKAFKQYAGEALHTRGSYLGIPLYRDGPLVGAAVISTPRARRNIRSAPIYVSPGNGISLGSAIALTMSCCVRKGAKLPEPIVLADRIGRDELAKLSVSEATGERELVSDGAIPLAF